jgi:hypothetical protein
MRNLFRGYYRPKDDELAALWDNSIFVFDANVLLNLYSYPESAREIFFSVLEEIKERVWIPYQVALEFHKNRTIRIKQSNSEIKGLLDYIEKYSQGIDVKLKKIEFEKRNTGINDIDVRIEAIHKANLDLSEAIQHACNKLPVVNMDEGIGIRIADIFEGKLGNPPESQERLDEIFAFGEDRYMKNIPPGFADSEKNIEYRDRGLVYKSKFGDLILWNQILDYVRNGQNKHIIFVTADKKKDWWLIDEGKTLGPLPELTQEFYKESEGLGFWMYTDDKFLENAKIHLNIAGVTEETIEQVKDVSSVSLSDMERYRNILLEMEASNDKNDRYKFDDSELGFDDDFEKSHDERMSFRGREREREMARASRRLDHNIGIENFVAIWVSEMEGTDFYWKPDDFPNLVSVTPGGEGAYHVVRLAANSLSDFTILNVFKKIGKPLARGDFLSFSIIFVIEGARHDLRSELDYSVYKKIIKNYSIQFPFAKVYIGEIRSEMFHLLDIFEG